MGTTPQVSVIIPTYNRGEILFETLSAAIGSLEGIASEIILVNDYKPGLSLPEELSGRVRLLHNPKQGASSARNYGATHASAELLLFVDDDIVLNPQVVQALIGHFRAEPQGCFNVDWVYPETLLQTIAKHPFGRYLIHFDYVSLKGALQKWDKKTHYQPQAVFPAHQVASYCVSIPRALFERIGGYDETVPFAGAEDYDISARLLAAGAKLYIDTRVVVGHNEADRSEQRAWFERKARGNTTSYVLAQDKYPELALNLPGVKRIIFYLLYRFYLPIEWLVGLLPSSVSFDRVRFWLYNLMLRGAVYKGYFVYSRRMVAQQSR